VTRRFFKRKWDGLKRFPVRLWRKSRGVTYVFGVHLCVEGGGFYRKKGWQQSRERGSMSTDGGEGLGESIKTSPRKTQELAT